MNIEYLPDILILLAAAVICVPLFQYLGLGAIPGFVLAGIAVGPSALSVIENYDEIAHFAELGVVLLLFIIGIEINPARLWRMKGLVLGLGSLQILCTGALLTLAAHLLIDRDWKVSLLIGAGLALSSTAFVLQLLAERKMLSTDYGKSSVAVLLMQDIAIVPLLVFVSLMQSPELTMAEDIYIALIEAAAILLVIVLAGRYVLTPMLNLLVRFGSPEIFTAFALLMVLGTAHAIHGIGLSMAMGAFIAGLLIADSSFRHQISAEIQPFRGLLLGLFFMSMGMSLNLGRFLETPLALIGIVIALLATKFLVLWPLARLFGLGPRRSTAVSLLLAQGGEFALVLFAVAKGLGLLEEILFQQLLIIVLLSMLATPLLERAAHRLVSASGGRRTAAFQDELAVPENETAPLILAGFGRMGRRVGDIMDLMEIPYVAIDRNASLVERERAQGRPVFYGHAGQQDVLRAAGVAEARLVIVSVDDAEASKRIVASLHANFPGVPVFARGHDLVRCRELKKSGAHFTVSETLEASAEIARAALLRMGAQDAAVELALETFRRDYYERLGRVSTKKAP